jgi:ABC-type multidrug transport system fused ATPase/permease subunit
VKAKSERAATASGAGTLRLGRILRPHWKALVAALVAVVGETVADVLEPWPITIVIDNILQGKRLPRPLEAAVVRLFGQNTRRCSSSRWRRFCSSPSSAASAPTSRST